MKAKQKSLIVMFLVLALLAVAFGVITLWTSREKKKEETTAVLITNFDVDSLTKISYNFEGEEIQLAYDAAKAEWVLADQPEQALNQTLVKKMASTVSDLQAERLLEDAGAPAEYGLNNPVLTVTATTGDTSYKIRFGNLNSMTSTMYVQLDGSNEIYTAAQDKFSVFQYGAQDLYADEESAASTAQN